jgi:hypothetical protein
MGAAGDVIYSKGRPLIRAGEKLMGMEPSGPPKVKPRTFQDPSTVAQGAIERRSAADLPEGTTTTVRNWTAGRPGEGAGQHAGEFLGGSNYSEADKFAKERAAFEAANPTMKVQPGSRLAIPEQDAEVIAKQRAALQAQANATNQAEVNAVAQNRADRLQERNMLKDQANRKNMLTGSANVVGKVALPIMGGYEAGAQGTQAYNRLTRPDLTTSDVAAGATNLLGSAAGMRSMFPGKARIPAAIISQGASAIANFLDKRNPRNEPEEQTAPKMANGGSVTSPKLKSLSDFLDQLMQQAAAPAPAPAPMAPPQGGMPPGMPPEGGMPPGTPPGMPPQQQQPPMQQSPLNAMMPQMQAGGRVGGGLELAKKLFDRRFDKRVGEVPKLESQVRHVEPTHNVDVPKIYLPDYEGHPFVTSMSDRTDASQRLLGLNNTMFNTPIDLTGGQGFMFAPRNAGKVWESGKGPSSAIVQTAGAAKDFTGKNPIYLPWRMAPTGSDFSPMTGETMLAHAQSVMGKKEKAAVDNLLKNYIPNWKGLDNPESFEQFGSAPTKARKAAQNAMDKHFRNEGGLGIGEARLAISDPTQINAPEGGLQNVGRIFSGQPIIRSGEGSRYPYGVPGEGLGVIDRDINIAQLLPKWAKERGIQDPTKPGATDMRSLQMKPYSGILSDEILKSIGFKKGGLV